MRLLGALTATESTTALELPALFCPGQHREKSPEVQKFVGALHGQKAKKGIFISTSAFTRDAKQYADGLEIRVILIDGVELSKHMFDHGIGVSTTHSYAVKQIDSDFFEDEPRVQF